jgi:hypothetical protein
MGEWLARREPMPPPALRARLEAELGDALRIDAAQAADLCLAAGARVLTSVLYGGGCDATRESALDLLAADALVTYAFEAAAESPAGLASRATAAMHRIAALGMAPEPGAGA